MTLSCIARYQGICQVLVAADGGDSGHLKAHRLFVATLLGGIYAGNSTMRHCRVSVCDQSATGAIGRITC